MKKFLLKLLLFITINGLILLLILLCYRPNVHLKTDYLAAIIDKHASAESITKPKILLIGGSNLAFGIDSKLLQDSIGLPVVNMGLHAGLGLPFLLAEAGTLIQPNDVVLLSLEYSFYNKDNQPNYDLIEQTELLYPNSKSFSGFSIRKSIYQNYIHFKKAFHNDTIAYNPIYNRNAFNKYGDVISHLEITKNTVHEFDFKLEKIQEIACLTEFKDLIAMANAKHATVYLLFPDLPRKEYEKEKETILHVEQLLKRHLSELKIIGNTESFVLNDTLFFDTVYHLNKKGRAIRTLQLINLLDFLKKK